MARQRTLKRLQLMSALPPKADIVQDDRDLRFVPKADMGVGNVTVGRI
jgi:hypothetical protein